MIVAIDGPAGSGKSTTAREVARRLGYLHMDSGAFYRALTHALLSAGAPEPSWERLAAEDLDRLRVRAQAGDDGFRLTVAGSPVGPELRTPDVNAHVSRVASIPAVRSWLLDRLRDLAGSADVVADGRDMGTVVFPNADVKVFLVADPEARARRRLLEYGTDEPDRETLLAEVRRLMERDRKDSEREAAPLRAAKDAIKVDTTSLTFEEQVAAILELVRGRQPAERVVPDVPEG